jgi:hypothetical protein
MKTRTFLWALSLALLALGAGRRAVAKEALKISPVLEVATAEGGWRVAEPAEVLCSGESFVLRVAVNQKAYIYVAMGRIEGRVAVLFPPEGSDPVHLRPGEFRLIPDPADGPFVLDPPAGDEHVVAVASPKPLSRDEVAALAKEALRGVTGPVKPVRERACPTAPAEGAPHGRPAPQGAYEKYRDVSLRQRLGRLRVRGAEVVRIPIVHR